MDSRDHIMPDRIITVGGFDPALRNFGMAKGSLNLGTGDFCLLDLALSKSEASDNKKTVRKNSDDLERARKQSNALLTFMEGVDLMMVEIPVGSQSARAMASYGISIGILSMLNIPMIQVTPAEVKMVTGHKNASKAQMIEWATQQYPDAPWLTQTRKGKLQYIGDNEHLADAVAAIHAGVLTDQFKQARALMNK